MLSNSVCENNRTQTPIDDYMELLYESLEYRRGYKYNPTPEETEALFEIEKKFGFPAPMGVGWKVTIWVYRQDDCLTDSHGNKTSIISPTITKAEDSYRSCTGLVIAKGPAAYKDEKFRYSGHLCQIGEFISFPRNEGLQLKYRGLTVQVIDDDRLSFPIDDPSYVQRD